MKKICSNCNSSFECDETPSCWCMEIPPISKEKIGGTNCLCKDCLLKMQ